MTPLVTLASCSPQRQALLEQLGVDFEVKTVDVEELTQGDPVEVAEANALAKLEAALPSPDRTVIAADTVVALGQKIFGKPRDARHASAMLEQLSGNRHEVTTAIAVVRPQSKIQTAQVTTAVKFRALSEPEIDWYVATGEWQERAGGYAIQGKGALLIEKIVGDYLTVVGLPVAKLLEVLPELAPSG